MKLKVWMIITAVLGLVFGIGYFLIPTQMMSSVGLKVDQALAHQAQVFGAALIAIGAMSWVARGESDSKARRAILLALFLYFVLGSISIFMFALTGIPNIGSWFILAFHLLLAMVYTYYLFVKRSA